MRSKRFGIGAVLAAMFVAPVAAIGVWAPAAGAATQIVVSTTTETGPGSIREAFATASGDGVDNEIVLQANATYVLTCLGGGALDHFDTHTLLLTGNGATIQQTCAGERVLTNVSETGHLTVVGVTITGGDASDKTAGGGIGATSTGLTVINSTIVGNSAGDAGGIFVTGSGALLIVNSTVTGNTAKDDSSNGGGVEGSGNITIVYSTIVGNSANNAGANVFASNDGMTTFGTVIANPLGGATNCANNSSGTSQGYNWSDDTSCNFNQATDHNNAGSPGLGTLADNGGGTKTMLPQTGSGLINAIPLAACQTGAAAGITDDQRFLARPSGAGCEIGSVEIQVVVPPQPPVNPPVIQPVFTG